MLIVVLLLTIGVIFQVAEDTWKTEYELKKKERTSMLANMSVQQHAFSIKQKTVLTSPQQFHSSSPPSVATSTKKNVAAIDTTPPPPALSDVPEETASDKSKQIMRKRKLDRKRKTDSGSKSKGKAPKVESDDGTDDGVACSKQENFHSAESSSDESETTDDEPSAKKTKWFGLF